MRAVHHGAADLFAFAGATGTVFAAIRQTHALANACGQHAFTGVHAEFTPAGQNVHLKRFCSLFYINTYIGNRHIVVILEAEISIALNFAFKPIPFGRIARPISP